MCNARRSNLLIVNIRDCTLAFIYYSCLVIFLNNNINECIYTLSCLFHYFYTKNYEILKKKFLQKKMFAFLLTCR